MLCLNRDENIFLVGKCFNYTVISTAFVANEAPSRCFGLRKEAWQLSSSVIPMLTSTVPTVAELQIVILCVRVCMSKLHGCFLKCLSTDFGLSWQ